jgi:tRNA-Thr(GGU) m(6)t(6)A37 methyltransferase TsaA
MESIVLKPIGIIRTPYKNLEGTPIQPSGACGVRGTVEVEEAFREGLLDLKGFSHVFLLYLFHQSKGFNLVVKPFLDDARHGVFSTRAPRRPNPIGLSVVRLVDVSEGTLHVEGVDMVDGTPLLDIKPFIPDFDLPCGEIRTGWLSGRSKNATSLRADNRFL